MLSSDLIFTLRALDVASGVHRNRGADARARSGRQHRHVQRHPRGPAAAAAVRAARRAGAHRRVRSRDQRARQPVAGRLSRLRRARRGRLRGWARTGGSASSPSPIDGRAGADRRRERHRGILPDAGRAVRARARVHRRGGSRRRPARRHSRPRFLAAALRRRPGRRRTHDHASTRGPRRSSACSTSRSVTSNRIPSARPTCSCRISSTRPTPNRGGHFIRAVGRLRAGPAGRCGARRARRRLRRGSSASTRATTPNQGVVVQPLHDAMVENARPVLLLLGGAVAFVLLVACANLANLLLAQGAVAPERAGRARRDGRGRSRLVRQLLTESVMLAVAGAAGRPRRSRCVDAVRSPRWSGAGVPRRGGHQARWHRAAVHDGA